MANFVIRRIRSPPTTSWSGYVAIQTAKGLFSVVLDVINRGYAIAAAFDEFEAGLEGVFQWLGTCSTGRDQALPRRSKAMIWLHRDNWRAAGIRRLRPHNSQFATMDGDINGGLRLAALDLQGDPDYGFQTQNAVARTMSSCSSSPARAAVGRNVAGRQAAVCRAEHLVRVPRSPQSRSGTRS